MIQCQFFHTRADIIYFLCGVEIHNFILEYVVENDSDLEMYK